MAAPLLASYVFFRNIDGTASGLQQVQWTYLGVAVFVALLAILFLVYPLPEVTDADMALIEVEIGEEETTKSFWKE
jgi:FHS family L-fucose permease-like MFS transporter